MQQANRGIKGIVKDRLTGRPIENATLSIQDRQNIFNTTKNGEYWKILLPGVYKLYVSNVEKNHVAKECDNTSLYHD